MALPVLDLKNEGSKCAKHFWTGEGDWTYAKEVLGWKIDTEDGMVALSKQKTQEITQLLAIPAMQRHIVRKELERLVGKLLYMYLAMPGAVAHIYHIQSTLKQGGEDRAWLPSDFSKTLGTGVFYPRIQRLRSLTWTRSSVKSPPTWGSTTPPAYVQEVCVWIPLDTDQSSCGITPVRQTSSWIWSWKTIQGGC